MKKIQKTLWATEDGHEFAGASAAIEHELKNYIASLLEAGLPPSYCVEGADIIVNCLPAINQIHQALIQESQK